MTLLATWADKRKIRLQMLFPLIGIHLLALAAPFTFTWPGLVCFLVMCFMTGCIGITLCYHRLLSHRSFKTKKWVKYFLMFCGTLSMEGDPAWWTANHRLHHRESDQEMDPHSPRVSFLWAHVLWLLYDDPRMADRKILDRFIPDLINDPWAKFLAKYFLHVNIAFLVGLYALGYALGGTPYALSMLVWGGFLRIVWVWHITWFVNSATHVWGYRNYETRDDSRNIWWVALVSFGEGWHNNHHAHPSAAKSGHQWWEFDVTYGVIKLLASLGLAWQIRPVVVTPASTTPLEEPKKIAIPSGTYD